MAFGLHKFLRGALGNQRRINSFFDRKDSASREIYQIYLSISEAQPIFAEGNVVQAEYKSKIYFDFVETQPTVPFG